MTSLAEYMSTDHKNCDEAFVLAEQAAMDKHWALAQSTFNIFSGKMLRHFRMEETVLFPALQEAGGLQGSVQVMLMEHAQVNELIEQMANAVNNRDSKEYGGLSETLLIVMQQHNLKEEQMLYPIAEQILAEHSDAILNRLQAV